MQVLGNRPEETTDTLSHNKHVGVALLRQRVRFWDGCLGEPGLRRIVGATAMRELQSPRSPRHDESSRDEPTRIIPAESGCDLPCRQIGTPSHHPSVIGCLLGLRYTQFSGIFHRCTLLASLVTLSARTAGCVSPHENQGGYPELGRNAFEMPFPQSPFPPSILCLAIP